MAAMTQYGEIMLPKEASTSADSKWIVPVCRLTTELGCVITWDRRGMRLNFPSGTEIKTKLVQGLCYVCWDDFKHVREALGKSHQNGRNAYDKVKANRVEVNPVYKSEYDGIVASGAVVNPTLMDPESVEAWMKWSSHEIRDDQHELVSMINKVCHGDHHDKGCGICQKHLEYGDHTRRVP